MKLTKIFSGLSIVAESLVLLLLNFVFLPCVNDKAMKCNSAHDVVCFLFIGLIIMSILDVIFVNNKRACFISLMAHANILFSVVAIPSFVIGGCMKPEMVCNTTTYPFIYFASFLLTIIRIVVYIVAARELKRENK